MLPPEYYDRFIGVTRLYGNDAAAAFAQAHVCIVGIGGVGSWAAESLARSGIAALTLVDLDDICLNNTNRQAHTLTNTIGRLKAEVMAERIRLINPSCKVTVRADFFTSESAPNFFEPAALPAHIGTRFSAVVDAIDSLKNKALLVAECLKREIPVIVSGGAGGRKNPNFLKTGTLGASHSDPLLKALRRELRRTHAIDAAQYGGVPTAYSTEPLAMNHQNLLTHENCPSAAPSTPLRSGRLDCASGFGTVMHITAGLGLQLGHLVLEEIQARVPANGTT